MAKETQTPNVAFIPKLSVATMGLDQDALLSVLVNQVKKTKKPVPVCRFVGMAQKMFTGKTDNGEWTGFKGMFLGQNYLTGEAFRSASCFLPALAAEMLSGMLGMAQVNAENASGGAKTIPTIQFAFEILLDESKKFPYAFIPVNLLPDNAGQDALSAILAQLPPIPGAKKLTK